MFIHGTMIVIQSIAVLIPLLFIVPIVASLNDKYGWVGLLMGVIGSIIAMGFYGYSFRNIIKPIMTNKDNHDNNISKQ